MTINPLALSEGGGFVALDAKMNFDDSALKRHPDIAALRDTEGGRSRLERARPPKRGSPMFGWAVPSVRW